MAVVDAAGDVGRVEALRHDVDGAPVRPARSSTSASGTPRQRATPIAPSFHGVPAAGVPCWLAKKLRPLPAHSMNAVTARDGSRCRSRSENVDALRAAQAAAEHLQALRARVDGRRRVWLRTKKRSFGIEVADAAPRPSASRRSCRAG